MYVFERTKHPEGMSDYEVLLNTVLNTIQHVRVFILKGSRCEDDWRASKFFQFLKPFSRSLLTVLQLNSRRFYIFFNFAPEGVVIDEIRYVLLNYSHQFNLEGSSNNRPELFSIQIHFFGHACCNPTKKRAQPNIKDLDNPLGRYIKGACLHQQITSLPSLLLFRLLQSILAISNHTSTL